METTDIQTNHYACNVDASQDVLYCSDHEIPLADDGTALGTAL